jgi:hypothetical protein
MRTWRFSFYLIVLLLPFCSLTAANQERVILAVESGKCTLRVEADDEFRSMRLRILPEDSGCYCSKEEMKSILQSAFAKDASRNLNGLYKSLFIGRLIDYPWLCEYLASAAYRDRMWDTKKGKPLSMGINRYIGALLSKKEILAPLEEAVAGHGYRIVSASVEKVLVGGFRDIPQYKGPKAAGKVPFDAMVWFSLER